MDVWRLGWLEFKAQTRTRGVSAGGWKSPRSGLEVAGAKHFVLNRGEASLQAVLGAGPGSALGSSDLSCLGSGSWRAGRGEGSGSAFLIPTP